jgi:hypothetical protein
VADIANGRACRSRNPALALGFAGENNGYRSAGMPRRRRRYIDVEMPERFVLEVLTPQGEWLDWGLYDSSSFVRLRDGTYLSATEGSPLYLRCLRQDGSVSYVMDGGGNPFTYRLVPFPGPQYRPSDELGG